MTSESSQDEPDLIGGDVKAELASNQTAMAFSRSQLAADRTLMSVLRTALALIGFGFTIYQFFKTLSFELDPQHLPPKAPALFGVVLIVLGVILLVLGIYQHWKIVGHLKQRRARLHSLKLVHNLPKSQLSPVTFVAVCLLFVGLLAFMRISFGMGPF